MPTASGRETLIALLAMALIALLCRWVFSPSHTVVRRQPDLTDYGLLVPVISAPSITDAVMLRDLLVSEGIRASVGRDGEVLVFAVDLERARTLVGA